MYCESRMLSLCLEEGEYQQTDLQRVYCEVAELRGYQQTDLQRVYCEPLARSLAVVSTNRLAAGCAARSINSTWSRVYCE